jgi:cytochrome bd ubiquinol oxidase subunit I
VPTLLELSRWQFAFTIMFRPAFPAITVGLAVFLAFVYGVYLRSRDLVYIRPSGSGLEVLAGDLVARPT